MTWQILLQPIRFRMSEGRLPLDNRNEFENDYSRIVFSSSFRRLQDKTQIFPCDPSDFVRTRLTHSIEVSSIGRSLGLSIEDVLINKFKIEIVSGEIGSILATAGLIHDIGNPPFGHHGEYAFKKFYSNMNKNGKLKFLSDIEINDLTTFDGNVQTFRLLKRLQLLKDQHSYNLSFPVLASIIKYPFSSMTGNDESKSLLHKKFGYFSTEEGFFREIWDKLEIKDINGIDTRHPITYLLEASDDIAYSIADIEDGTKKGIITFKEIIEGLELNCKTYKTRTNRKILRKAKIIYKEVYKNMDFPNKDDSAIQQFRIVVQGIMINAVIKEFKKNYYSIMNGTYNRDILESSEAGDIRRLTKKFACKIFDSPNVIKQEILGERVLTFLLEQFIEAALSDERNETKTKHGKIFSLISDNFKYIKKNHPSKKPPNTEFNRILLVNDFISGMTDNYALKLYKDLNGI